MVKLRKTARVLSALSLIWFLNCCASQHPPLEPVPEPPPSPIIIMPETPVLEPKIPVEPKSETDMPEPRFFVHKVRWPEETLSHIAKWYTGTMRNWKIIAKTNPELDPNEIHVGDTISIPEELLILREPIPHFFVRPSKPKKIVPLSSSKKTTTKPESPKLFGPIESESSPIESDSAKLFGPVETRQPTIEPDATNLFGPVE